MSRSVYSGNVVVIAGGTGGFTAAKGLKHYTTPSGLTVVVSGGDDGGSTGRLRKSYDIQPPGDARKIQEALADEREKELLDRYGPLPETDVRRSLVALADDTGLLRSVFRYRFHRNGSLKGKSIDELLTYALKDIGEEEGVGEESMEGWVRRKRETLFNQDTAGEMIVKYLRNYTFDKEDEIEGHALGNLLILAITHITGSYVEALDLFSKMLKAHGTVLPVTLDKVILEAERDDGIKVRGEENIDSPKDIGHRFEKLRLDPSGKIYYRTAQAIVDADLIVIGPGDLYSSVIQTLIIDGLPETLKEAKQRKNTRIVYACNLVTEPGETNRVNVSGGIKKIDGFTAGQHLEKIINHLGQEGLIDFIVCNSRMPSYSVIKRYEEDNRTPVEMDKERIENLGVTLIESDLIGDEETKDRFLRHDPQKLARVLTSVPSL